jgi:hypothetical protein
MNWLLNSVPESVIKTLGILPDLKIFFNPFIIDCGFLFFNFSTHPNLDRLSITIRRNLNPLFSCEYSEISIKSDCQFESIFFEMNLLLMNLFLQLLCSEYVSCLTNQFLTKFLSEFGNFSLNNLRTLFKLENDDGFFVL